MVYFESISQMRNISRNFYGTIIVVSGVILVSPDSLLIRSVKSWTTYYLMLYIFLNEFNRYVEKVPNFTVGFYRFIFCAISSTIFFLSVRNRKCLEIIKYFGYFGTFAGMIWGLQNFTIVYAIQMTSAANALVIFALNPIFASILGYFILSQAIPLRTILTSIICFGCITFIFYSELNGHPTVNNIIDC